MKRTILVDRHEGVPVSWKTWKIKKKHFPDLEKSCNLKKGRIHGIKKIYMEKSPKKFPPLCPYYPIRPPISFALPDNPKTYQVGKKQKRFLSNFEIFFPKSAHNLAGRVMRNADERFNSLMIQYAGCHNLYGSCGTDRNIHS